MSKSIFSSTDTNKTLFSGSEGIITTTETSMDDEISLINKLLTSYLAVKIQNVVTYYYNGDFEMVLQLLTKDNLVYYLTLLESYKKSSITYTAYEKVRLLLKLYLHGLIKCIDQYLELVNADSKILQLEERVSILDNMDKLKEYIDGLNSTVNLFRNIPPATVTKAQILPEHVTYLKKYGYPVGGIFDVKLLKDIIIQQNLQT